MSSLHRSTSLSDLLVGFEEGDLHAQEAFPARVRGGLLRLSRQHAANLSPEQHQDVVQQTFVNLLCTSREYNPEYSVWTYMKGHVRNAIRQVRAAYAPPGPVENERADSDPNAGGPANGASLDDVPESVLEGTTGRDAERKVDARIMLEAARRLFGDGTEKALKFLSRRSTRKEAAKAAGYSPRTLDRRLSGLQRFSLFP